MLPVYGVDDDELVPPLTEGGQLRAMYKAIGHRWEVAPDPGGPTVRHAVVEDPSWREITSAPVPLAGFIDGVQRRRLLDRRGPSRRPVSLEYAAAGCFSPHLRRSMSFVERRLVIVCSYEDEAWARGICSGIPVVVSEERWPEELANDAVHVLDRLRRQIERLVCSMAPAVSGALIVRDGNLAHDDPARPDLVGVVKNGETEYPGTGDLSELPVGWRGPILRFPARMRGGRDIWTCHYRLSDAAWLPSLAGVIRLETFLPDPAILEGLAAAVGPLRQSSHSGDSRWPVHLSPVAFCEKVLRDDAASHFL